MPCPMSKAALSSLRRCHGYGWTIFYTTFWCLTCLCTCLAPLNILWRKCSLGCYAYDSIINLMSHFDGGEHTEIFFQIFFFFSKEPYIHLYTHPEIIRKSLLCFTQCQKDRLYSILWVSLANETIVICPNLFGFNMTLSWSYCLGLR